LNVSELMMSLTTADDDLALVFRLSVVNQLHRPVQLPDGIREPTLSKQQNTVLSSRDNGQLAQ
jgi:hypothetical protein